MVAILALVLALAMSLGFGLLVLVTQAGDSGNDGTDKSPDDKAAPAPDNTNTNRNTGGTWKPAYSTVYNSFPPCCPKSPTFNAQASTWECDNNSGCEYLGQFAALGPKDFEWVKNSNIVAFFQAGQTAESWRRDWANKKLRLRNPATGNTMDVTVADTCGDKDCDGCCTKNANLNGGTLIDLENFTAKRFFSPGKVQGASKLEWQCLNC